MRKLIAGAVGVAVFAVLMAKTIAEIAPSGDVGTMETVFNGVGYLIIGVFLAIPAGLAAVVVHYVLRVLAPTQKRS